MSGLTGAGVKVGVISDGVDSRATAQTSGDLPLVLDIDPGLPGEGDEGTALLEIVHDLAPGARLAFSGPVTSVEMVESIEYLATDAFGGSGSDVIVDDLGFLAEPYFADGMVARAAQEAVDGGAVFISSAGNDGRNHYEGSFAAGGENYHAFGANDTALAITARQGSIIILQWNDQFGTSANDYDLYVCLRGFLPTDYNLNNSFCLASGGPQDGDDYPIEGVLVPTSDPPESDSIEMDVFIHAFDVAPSPPGQLKLFVTRGSVDEYGSPAGSIYGHPAVADVIAVGAIDASDPENNDSSPSVPRGRCKSTFPPRRADPSPTSPASTAWPSPARAGSPTPSSAPPQLRPTWRELPPWCWKPTAGRTREVIAKPRRSGSPI